MGDGDMEYQGKARPTGMKFAQTMVATLPTLLINRPSRRVACSSL